VDPAREQPPDLDQLVAGFAQRVPEVLHVLVVAADGVALAEPARADQLAAITAGLISLADGAARTLDWAPVVQALVVMERGTLVIMAIDDTASLAVLTAAADLDLVGYEMTMLAERVAAVVAGRTPDPPGAEPW
jgi:predicted regulator of Ras-like GTPase activity (Roadblock/LC7/MglB family)